ncbi:MAG: TIGR04282 family arsenosugar biosynthesis glycosyltransferase [Gammaproteobacteria bacterium]|nr:TIGR04282 family arsenosugar biosynthesis glycosyltransferase [Gammaproteobacteria bacterium]
MNLPFPDARIMVFAKAPVAGAVKTRLIPALGAEGAAALHAMLVRHCIATAVAARLSPVELWCSPDTNHPFFTQCSKDYGVTLREQQGNDLGARMAHAFDTVLQRSPCAVIIGTDCPALTSQDLRTAIDTLVAPGILPSATLVHPCTSRDGFDAVIGPAEDGGYVLLGLRKAAPLLFEDIAWGSGGVLALTRERLKRLQWRWRELAPRRDVDRPEDLEEPQIRRLLVEAAAMHDTPL